MRIGAILPFDALADNPLDGHLRAAGGWARSAAVLERLGYDSIWVFDAVGRGFILPDPLMALMAAAVATTTVELGTGVLQLPLRNTVDTAWRALTLHHLSGGRFLFGVGPGSTKADFDALGVDYTARFAAFKDQLDDLQTLFRTGRLGASDLRPWPDALGGPAVLIGAWRGPWVVRAAAAQGWIASAAHNGDATLADAISRFRDAGGTRAVVTNVQVGRNIGPAIERLHRLRAMGFDDGVAFDLKPTEERLAAVLDAARS